MRGLQVAWARVTRTRQRVALATSVGVAAVLVGAGLAMAGGGLNAPEPTALGLGTTAEGSEPNAPGGSPTPASTASPSLTWAPSPTTTPSASPTVPATPSPTPTATVTPTPIATPTPDASPSPSQASLDFAQPVLVFLGPELHNGWTDYWLSIENWQEYPGDLFEISTTYPCGQNPQASRTRVHIFNAVTGGWVYGHCAMAGPEELSRFGFSVMDGQPPASLYVVLWDQRTGVQYSSNIVDLGGG